MKFRLALIFTAFFVLMPAAQAASAAMSVIVNSTPVVTSTSISCTPTSTFIAPLAAGAAICSANISPSNWQGVLTLTGVDASFFALSGSNLVVGPTALAARAYSITLTSTP